MNKFYRFLVVAFLIAITCSMAMSACTRGYGCPYKTQVSAQK